MHPRNILAACGVAALLHASASAAVEIKQEADKVTVAVGGQPFTEFHFTGASHVYFWPLLGPGGVKMTRSWPMEDVAGEEHDHPHHRSLWFAHGDVNGIDFWAETASYKAGSTPKMPLGKIEHVKFLQVQGGEKEGIIKSENRWVAADGSVPLTSTQTFQVYETTPNERLFDFSVTLTAGEKDVTMADTKEGTMALRVAESMRVMQPKTKPAGQGHMLSSEGVKDAEVWGKRADWIDYFGPVEGKTMGIAIFASPYNSKEKTRWHARDYGLFAVNPFCSHEMDKTTPEHSGDVVIKAGQSLTLNYRFLIHEGEASAEELSKRFRDYSVLAGK